MVRFARSVAAALCLGAAVSSLYLEVDGALANLYSSRPTFAAVSHTGTGQQDLRIYVMPGVTASDALLVQIIALASEHGAVKTVLYPPKFDADEVNQAITQEIRQDNPRRLILIGSSMGGRLLGELLHEHRYQLPRRLGVILNDAPMTATDIMQPGSWVSEVWEPGPIANATLRRPFWRLFAPPITGNLDDPLFDAKQRRHAFEYGRNFPLSTYGGQVRFLNRSQIIRRGALSGIPAVHIQSTADRLISARASDKWEGAFGGFVWQGTVNAGHADYLGEPSRYKQAFARGIEEILPRV